jgi:hypothetical protein
LLLELNGISRQIATRIGWKLDVEPLVHGQMFLITQRSQVQILSPLQL